MANTFSNSLDVSSFIDEVAPETNPQAQPPLADFADEIAQAEFVKTAAAARWAKKYDPQSYAEAAKLAPEVPPEVGIRQLELLRESSQLEAYKNVFDKSPALRGYFAERPKELALAKPDELDNLSGVTWAWEATKQSARFGAMQIEAAAASNRIAAGKGTIQDEAFLKNYNYDRTFGAQSFMEEALVLTAQQIPQLAGTAMSGLRGGAQAGAITGAFGAGIGTTVPGIGTIAGGLTGFGLGARAGLMVGGFAYQKDLQTGLARIEFQNIRDEDGMGLDPDVAEFAAQVTGSGGALLESLALGQIIRVIPGGDRVLGLVTKDGMKAALRNPSVRTALTGFVKNLGATVGTEMATEILQQGLQIIAGEMAKANSDGNFAEKTKEEIMDELGQTVYQTAQVMALMGPFAAGTRFGADIVEINRSHREHKALTGVLEQVSGNELIQRSPELASKVIDRQLNDQKLFIPADEAQQLFQEQGLDLYGPPLPNWKQRVDEALSTGGDIEVSVGEFVAFLSKDPKENPLLALVRTNPQGYTQAEIQPYSEAADEIMLSEIALAQKKFPDGPSGTATQQIEVFPEMEELKKQIQAIGFTQKATEQYVTMLSAYFNTMANRTGKSATEFFNEFKLSVQGGMLSNVNDGSLSPDTYFQENRGSVQFVEGKQAVVNLFEGHDMSTLLHESGHFFLNTLRETATSAPDLQQDWDTIRKHLKIGEDGKITREQHEQFARITEAYFMEGKAPSPELVSAFKAFAQWLKTLYRNIKQLGGKVDPEIAGVFDRMLVVEDRLAEIAADTAYAPIFKTAEEMGISPEAYTEYLQLVDDLVQSAQASSVERIAGQTKRLAKGWRGEIQKQLAKEAEAKLEKEKPYSVIKLIKEKKISINREAFEAKYGKEAGKKLPQGALKKDGLEPAVAAELLGYVTADDMVYDFVQAPPIKQAAKEIAAAEMINRYGDDFDNSEVMNIAIKQQLAEDARLIILGKELTALSSKAGRTVSEKGPRQLAKQIAEDTIAKKKVGEINQVRTQAAVRRAAAMAQAAMVKGDWATAANWKRKQMIAQAIDNETQKANRAIVKIRDKAARYTRTTSKSIHPSFMEQIRALVEQYEFTKVSKKKLERRQSLAAFVKEQEADGQVVIGIPDRLLRDAGKVNYKELSVEDMLGLGDTLTNLEHLGRTKQKIRTAQGQREFAAVKNEILTSIAALPKRKSNTQVYSQDRNAIKEFMVGFHASLLKPEQIISWLDADNISGPMMMHVFQPIADAQNAQNEMNLDYNGKLTKIFENIDSAYLSEVLHIPEINSKMTRQELYSIALNTGNEGNRRKLMEGELWSEQQLTAVLNNMTKQDWEAVQKIWDLLNTLWPKIAALEKKLTGVAPPRVEGKEFTNQHGTFAGGYYPVIYDFKERRGKNLIEDTTPADKVIADGLFNNDFVRPGTNHKHTVKRTAAAKPIKRDLAVLPGHIHNVIHDLTYREAIRSAYKILWDPDVRRAIEDAEGEATYGQLTHWLKAVATEHSTEPDPATRFITRMRTGATMFSMGYRLTTALAQPLGFFTSLTRVSKRSMANGIYQMTRHPIKTLEMVNTLSGELKGRFNTQDRDIHDTVRQISLKASKADAVRRYAFYMIGAMDKYVATATWLGAYQDALQKTPGDEAAAIRHADRTVRLTQGTGTVKDMAKMTNNGELLKLFTMFYSFFSAQYNMQVDLTRKTRRDISAGDWHNLFAERLPQWAYLVVFPAIFGALLTGQGPDEDENPAWWATRKVVTYPTVAVPFVKDVVGSWESGFDYKLSPAGKFLQSTSRAVTNFGKLFTEDSEFDPIRLAKPAAEAGAIIFKLPAGQAITTVDALWQGLEKGDMELLDPFIGRQGR
jgi:hypothetical protein